MILKNKFLKLGYLPKVFLMGGLGNQLWIINYAFNLTLNSDKVIIDDSWYQDYSKLFFNKKRVIRNSYSEIFRGISDKFIFYNSPLSLLKYRFIKSLNLRNYEKFYSYYQTDITINKDFKRRLSKLLISYLSKKQKLMLKEKFNFLSKKISLHLRIGDKGLPSKNEIDFIESLLKKIKHNEELILFSDSQKDAEKFIKRFLDNKLIFLEGEDEIFNIVLLAFCKKTIILRESTFSFWGTTLSNELKEEFISLFLDNDY